MGNAVAAAGAAIQRQIAAIIAALQRAVAEAARLRAQASSSSGSKYASGGYQVYVGATQVLVTDGAGDAALTIANFDGIVPNDDGLDLFNMTPATTILSSTITNPASVQKPYVYGNSQDTNAALTKYPTKIAVRYRPVKGGPFRTDYQIDCSALIVPKTIDLEAPSA